MRIPESELIINGDGSVFHIHLKPEELADNVIMVGDPSRVDMIAEYLTDIEFRHASREFVSVTGKYNGKRITALSHGIGPDNIDIVMTELDALANVDFKTREVKPEHRALNILRIGTSGALHADIPLGSYVLAHISVGFDGVMNWYANREKVTIPEVEEAFKKHMNWNPYLPSPYFVKASNKIIDLMKDVTLKGVTISAPGFYGPQGRIVRLPLAMPNMLEDVESFRFSTGGEDYRITNFEMESSPLAGLAAHLGHHASTVCCIIANRYLQSSNPDYKPAIRKLVELCLEKMSTL
ncbi:MAG: nucleoside phosphorylase [Candidatus Cryptobacteroides sp.]|jgi:uridine phosphorylase|nr:nucleoside phosphorylase [Candidatus Cryptobacteroides sp.]MEE3465228.1 nucleoside phosphorylase [Candidatus Cryptobacteroides sp.]